MSAIFGRPEELDRLLAVLDRAAAGQPGVGLIGGDAGIGKTRLVTELATDARARGWTVLIGQCAELGDALPYLPLADALHAASLGAEGRSQGGGTLDAATAASLSEAVRARPVLGRLLPDISSSNGSVGSDAGLTQQQLFGAVLGMLGELSQAAPVLLVFEDLHWADRSTRDLLTFLSRVLQRERVFLVGTYRTDDLHRRHPLRPLIAELQRLPAVTTILLHALDRNALANHLINLAGGYDAEVIEPILVRAEGNPFYAEELLDATASGDPLPAALADLLLARVERLSEVAQQVLRVAAVSGRRVDDDLVRMVSKLEPGPYDEALREIVSHQLLVPHGDGYTFRHALLREVVYADLMPGERTRLHASFAALLADRNGSAAELAYHYLASHDSAGALRASVQAGLEAERLGAPAEAHRHYDEALSLWEAVPNPVELAGVDRAHLALRSAGVAADSGNTHRATAQLRRLRDAVAGADPVLIAEINERLSYYLADENCEEAAYEAASTAVDAIPAEPPTPLLARALATYARSITGTDRHLEVAPVVERALAAARATSAMDAEASALVTLGLYYHLTGPFAKADELFIAARDLARSAGDLSVELRAAFQLARAEYERGDVVLAVTTSAAGVKLATDSGLDWSPYGIDLRFLQYLAHYAVGDWDRAEALADPFGVRVGNVAQATLSAYALFVEVGRGRPRVDERLVWLAPLWSSDEFVTQIARGLAAEHAAWRGEESEALAHVAAAMNATVAWDSANIRVAAIGLWICADRAVAARAAGRIDTEALRTADDLIEKARFSATNGPAGRPRAGLGPEGRGWLARAEAEWQRAAGDDDPALWRTVVEEFDFGVVYEVARSRWRLAAALVESGDRDAALVEWRLAVAVADRLGAVPLRRVLADLGRRARFTLVAAAAPELTVLHSLTSREHEVLTLVAKGMGNREIATTLFISPKTASVHVSNILAKLGATSRTQAAAIAHREGI